MVLGQRVAHNWQGMAGGRGSAGCRRFKPANPPLGPVDLTAGTNSPRFPQERGQPQQRL